MKKLSRLFSYRPTCLTGACRWYRRFCALMLACTVFGIPLSTNAAIITAESTWISGTQWSTSFVVAGEAGDPLIEEFSIYFAPGLYDSLSVVMAPAGWDAIVIQPDTTIPADGFFDALALGIGIAPGESLAGFVVSFQYLGSGMPPAQRFELIDPVTFDIIGRGMTRAPVVAVPSPGTVFLFSTAFVVLMVQQRRRWAGASSLSRS